MSICNSLLESLCVCCGVPLLFSLAREVLEQHRGGGGGCVCFGKEAVKTGKGTAAGAAAAAAAAFLVS